MKNFFSFLKFNGDKCFHGVQDRSAPRLGKPLEVLMRLELVIIRLNSKALDQLSYHLLFIC